MTLITAVCTADWVALAADRRLTAGGAWSADVETKVAIVDGEYLVGYAGEVPIIDGQRGFERWLAQGVIEFARGDIHSHLLDYLTVDEFLVGKPFMLVTAGFASNAFRQATDSEIVLTSNSMTDDGNLRRDGVTHPFRSMRVAVGVDGRLAIKTVGEPVVRQEVDLHIAPLNQPQELSDATLPCIYSALSNLYVNVAAQSNGAVGQDVVITTLPRAGFGQMDANIGNGQFGGPEMLARSVFRRADGRRAAEFSAARLSSRRPGRPGVCIVNSTIMSGDDIECGPRPHIAPTRDDPGNYGLRRHIRP